MSEAHFSALFSPNDNSLTIRELLSNNHERTIRENESSKNRSPNLLRRDELQQRRQQVIIDAKRKLEQAERAMTILNALDDKRWPVHARDSLDAMLDRSEAASSSTSTHSSRVPPSSPTGNFQLRKRECIILPLDDFASLKRSLKRPRLNETSPFDTLNSVRGSVLSRAYPHVPGLQSPSLYARESLERSRMTHSFDDSFPRPTVSNRNSVSNDAAESRLPLVTNITETQMEPSVREDVDSRSSETSDPLSSLETDEPAIPVQPLFSKISFKKVSPLCINFTVSESDFARSSEVNHTRLKRLLGKQSGKNDSGLLKSVLKKQPIEPVAYIPSNPAPVTFGADSSSQDAPVLKFSSSVPALSATPSIASNNEPNIFTATPLTTGSKPSSLSNARRKFARR